MSSWTPKPGNGLPSREPCSACGKVGDKWMKRGWCAACYQRWDNNGRPESGPARVYLPRTSGAGTCTACGAEDVIRKTANEWCKQCYGRWEAAGKPDSGPPPKRTRITPPPKRTRGRPPAPVGQCPICDRIAPLLRDGWCRVCEHRWHKGVRRARNLDKLTRLRVMWTLARPGEENPYECFAPGCCETADPMRNYQCAMHENRLRRTGAYGGFECIQCGDDIKSLGGRRKLCDTCRESWGYCGDSAHQGQRLLPRESFPGMGKTQCKSCINRRSRQERRSRGLHGALGGLAKHYRLGEKPCPRCLGFLNSA